MDDNRWEPLSGDKDTLYFIGNGFDLFHESVKSKFVHFYSWMNLKDKQHEQFVIDLENIFPESCVHGNLLWTDFEQALGQFNIESVHANFSGKEDSRIFDENYQVRAANYVHRLFARIPVYLREWAKEIDIEMVRPVLPLCKESQYLTFNYTLLLEDVYNIPSNHILHIHNSISDDKPLITGHRQGFQTYFDEFESDNERISRENLAREIIRLRKPVEDIIQSHKAYFSSLVNINKVVVFGHSLSDIDLPYFQEVIKNVQDGTKWFFTVHDDTAKSRYETLVMNCNSDFNDPKTYGVKQYKNKIRLENCNYFSIKDLIQIIN